MQNCARCRPRILLAGEFDCPDFGDLRAWLARNCTVQEHRDPASCRTESPHELMLLCQSRPGRFSQADVEGMHRSAPLAGLIGVLGTWCEGESRSGRPWHGIERMYWYEAPARLKSMLAQPPSLSFRTESSGERIWRHARQLPNVVGRTAVIVARRREYELLAAVCQALKITPYRHGDVNPLPNVDPEIVLTAKDDLVDYSLQESVASLRCQWPQARIVALLNFPRRDAVAALEAAGCNAVLGKPVMIRDLASALV
jgi:hypothetical protein